MNKRNRPFDGSQAPYYTGAEPPNHVLIPIRAEQHTKQGRRTGPFVEAGLYGYLRKIVAEDRNLRQYKPKMADILRFLLQHGLDHVTARNIDRSEIPHPTRTVTTCEFDPDPLDKVAELAKVLLCSPHDVIAAAIFQGYRRTLGDGVALQKMKQQYLETCLEQVPA